MNTSLTTHDPLAVFPAVFVTLYVAHLVGDQWVQTSAQAAHKAHPGWPGRLACARHVLTYHLTLTIALAALCTTTGWTPHPGPAAAGLTISAITHYVADRRTPLIALASLAGLLGYINHCQAMRSPDSQPETTGPGTALFHLDQSWHITWLAIAAMIIAR